MIDQLILAIRQAYRMDETICIKVLLKEAAMSEDRIQKIENQGRDLVHQVRQYRLKSGGKSLISKGGEPLVREATVQAMKILGDNRTYWVV